MALRIAETILNAACDAAVDAVDGGAGANGTLEFYSGAKPANLGDAPAGDLLAVLDFANPAFGASGASTPGEASALSVPLSTTGITDGTLGFARVLDTDGTVLWDEDDIGTAGTNAITVNTTSVSTGVNFEVTSYVFFAAS